MPKALTRLGIAFSLSSPTPVVISAGNNAARGCNGINWKLKAGRRETRLRPGVPAVTQNRKVWISRPETRAILLGRAQMV